MPCNLLLQVTDVSTRLPERGSPVLLTHFPGFALSFPLFATRKVLSGAFGKPLTRARPEGTETEFSLWKRLCPALWALRRLSPWPRLTVASPLTWGVFHLTGTPEGQALSSPPCPLAQSCPAALGVLVNTACSPHARGCSPCVTVTGPQCRAPGEREPGRDHQ